MHLCIFEDQYYSNFLPLAYFRPVYDLRSGMLSLRSKIVSLLPRATQTLFVRRELSALLTEENPRTTVNGLPDDDCWFVNGRLLADEAAGTLLRQRLKGSRVFMHHGSVAAAFVARRDVPRAVASGPITDDSFPGIPAEQHECTLLRFPWELIHRTPEEIERDLLRTATTRRGYRGVRGTISGVHLINKKHLYAGKNCTINAGAVLDASDGPIVIGSNVTVMPNAVIEGPAFIGDHSIVKIGAKLYHGTSVGAHCKVGGEIECSVIQSYSNKQHDGYLGHSYLGSWINLGAGTNTSDLKNTYGTVKVDVHGTLVDTQSQFVGMIMGDHAKAGISTMFNSGTVVGVSCNVYGPGFQPKTIPSFSWGEPGSMTDYDLEKSLSTARRMMARRDVTLSPAYEEVFRRIYTLTNNERHTGDRRPG